MEEYESMIGTIKSVMPSEAKIAKTGAIGEAVLALIEVAKLSPETEIGHFYW